MVWWKIALATELYLFSPSSLHIKQPKFLLHGELQIADFLLWNVQPENAVKPCFGEFSIMVFCYCDPSYPSVVLPFYFCLYSCYPFLKLSFFFFVFTHTLCHISRTCKAKVFQICLWCPIMNHSYIFSLCGDIACKLYNER